MERIDLGYAPRTPFVPFHRRKERFACIVAHRRAGKTVASVMDLVDSALRCPKPNGRFAYVAPYYAQAKDVVWAYLKRFTGPIPGAQANESELRVDLPTGARVRLYGADNYDRLRGIYLDGVVLDEFADMPPQAWREVIRPALADRQGWAAFIGTPKGRNAFCELYESAERDPEWFALTLRASTSGIVPPAELSAMRAQMSETEYRREMECDFDAAVEGAYYANALVQAQEEGRITELPYDPILDRKAYWDLGIDDAMTIWITQWVKQRFCFMDYIEGAGQGLDYYVAELRRRGHDQAECVLPHDGANRSMVTGKRFSEHLREAGFRVRVRPNTGKGAASVRIEALRRVFPRIWFNSAPVRIAGEVVAHDATLAGRQALSAYHERKDEKRNVGLGPTHDWASHGADSAGLAALDYEEPRANIKPPEDRSVYTVGSDDGAGTAWMGA